MATKNVTIPESYKGLKAVYITPSEEGLLRRTSHPKGSPQPKKGPGGLLMMDGEENRDRMFAKKHGISYKEVREAGGSTSDKILKKVRAAPKKAAPKVHSSGPKKAAPKSSGKEAIREAARVEAVKAGGTRAGKLPGPGAASSFVRVRGGYDPDTRIDYTNTNPGYWSSVKSYFENHSNNTSGETGIWIPNLEKEGAGATFLAARAGGVRAIEGSNYARALPGEVPGAERAMTMESIFRGGTDAETGYGGEKLGRLGKIGRDFHGATVLGDKVVAGPGGRYVSRGGDFGGLLGKGTAINTSMLDGLLGPRDGDGMRLGGTYPTVRGAATSDPVAGGGAGGGTGGGMGGVYGGGGISGGGPVVPTYMSDWSKFMPKNFSLGEAMYDKSGAKVAPGGFLYQPHAADYLGGMSTPGGGYYTGGAAVRSGGLLGGSRPVTFGGSPPVTFTPPTASTGSRPLAVTSAGSPVGTRMGMTPGPHSSHLGAYDRGDGTWVWGTMPSEGGHDPTGGGIAHSVSPMSSLASSPTLGPGAHPISVAMALAGPMAPTSHTTAPGTYSHEALEAAAEAAAGTAETGGMGAGGMAGGGLGGGVR